MIKHPFGQFQYPTVPLHQLRPMIPKGAETMNTIFKQQKGAQSA
jgi:hypothetical protein